MNAILLDIEGTTTPVDFVHQKLFPYSKDRMDGFVRENFIGLQAVIPLIHKEYRNDFAEQLYGRDFKADDPGSVSSYLKFLIDIDRKSTSLKSIQGAIWQRGYETAELRSAVFNDVPAAFKRWKAAGLRIAIFSSGSVLAQELIFGHSDAGDLTEFIDGYFDTTTGPKRDRASYRAIARELRLKPSEVTFLSDVVQELDAARSAGMQTALVARGGNPTVTDDHAHRVIENFDGV